MSDQEPDQIDMMTEDELRDALRETVATIVDKDKQLDAVREFIKKFDKWIALTEMLTDVKLFDDMMAERFKLAILNKEQEG